jgi:hypothetical protein
MQTPREGGVTERITERMEAGRHAAADRLEEAADTLQDRSQEFSRRGGRLSEIADRTAHRMSDAAQYMRSHDMNDVWRDVQNFLRRYPAESVAAALVLGILAGRALRRD